MVLSVGPFSAAGSALGVDSGEQASCEDFLGPQVLGSRYHQEQVGCGLPSLFVEDRLRPEDLSPNSIPPGKWSGWELGWGLGSLRAPLEELP